MGTEFIIAALIIIVLIVFISLNNKINRLENELNSLKNRLTDREPIKSRTEIKKPIQPESVLPAPIIDSPQQNLSVEKPIETIQPKPTSTHAEMPQKTSTDWFEKATEFAKQNALTLIGILTLVLGIGYFVKYAIDKNWIGETMRMFIGFAVGAGVVMTGHFLRKNYTVFASIITGGGIAVLYFTTTIAFREYHLFTQNTAFAVISLITVVTILLSYFYKSEILIICSLLGGFLAPLMVSTGESNYLFLFTYLTLINAGMLVIAYLRNWKSIGWIAFGFTFIYFSSWLMDNIDIKSIYFIIVSYIIFYAFALINYFRKSELSVLDVLMLVIINFTSIAGLVFVFYDLNYEPVSLLPFLFALFNGIFVMNAFIRKKTGNALNVFTGITIGLFSIAVALQFNAHLITCIWSVEAALLLYLSTKTEFKALKAWFFILLPFVVISLCVTWFDYLLKPEMKIIINPVFISSLVVTGTFIFELIIINKARLQNDLENRILELITYATIYLSILFELIYSLSGQPWICTFIISLLFTICYSTLLLGFRNQLKLNPSLEVMISYLLLVLFVVYSFVPINQSIFNKEIAPAFYSVYLLSWIPFFGLAGFLFSKINFYKTDFAYWIVALVFVIMLSMEFYHIYMLSNYEIAEDFARLTQHFIILYLPILWAVLSVGLIYFGIRKLPELNKIGFVLLGITILKLYIYDVWQMDNISRIIAFIVLGAILLISSFTFQRLKLILQKMMDKQD